jgi:hypothetical protein
VERACRVYRPRDPRKTALWGLLDTLYERVKGEWEERFERRYGFWRGLTDEVVARYLDCGDWNSGFARVRCRRCPEEFLVAFSCYLELKTIRSFWKEKARSRVISALLGVLKDADFFG